MSVMLHDDVRLYMWDWLRQYINDYCIERVADGQPKIMDRSGEENCDYIFYLRRGLFDSTFLNYVGMLFWDVYAAKYRHQPFQIAGLETGSTPLIVGLTMTAPAFDIHVNSFSIRKEKKAYGLFNRLEGNVIKDMPVMIVDDLINTAYTTRQARHHLLMEECKLMDTVFAVLDKQFIVTKDFEDQTMFEREKEGVTYTSLFSFNHFDLNYELYQSKKQQSVANQELIVHNE